MSMCLFSPRGGVQTGGQGGVSVLLKVGGWGLIQGGGGGPAQGGGAKYSFGVRNFHRADMFKVLAHAMGAIGSV